MHLLMCTGNVEHNLTLVKHVFLSKKAAQRDRICGRRRGFWSDCGSDN